MKTRYQLNTKFIIVFILSSIIFASIAIADSIQVLQQRANFAYEKMMKAQYNAELLEMEVTDAEKKLQRARKSLERAEQEAEIARRKSNDAKLSLEQAQQSWRQASDALANEWENSKKN